MIKDVGTKLIETERLILRRFQSDDAPAMFKNWCNDALVTRYLTWYEHKNVDETEMILKQWLELYDQPHTYRWAITLRNKQEPIGSIDVVRLKEGASHADIGYCIGANYWGLGIMTEALNAVIDYLFKETNMNRISARHETANPASGKVMLKAGMQFEGVMREAHLTKHGTYSDMALYAILQKDYHKNTIDK